jgi:hypothetical protein
MEFKEQITDVELVIDRTPRVYIQWRNTIEGYDKTDCYERIEVDKITVFYRSFYNRSSYVYSGNKFFETLEQLYAEALAKQNKTLVNAESDSQLLFKEYDFIIANLQHGTSTLGKSKEVKEHHKRILDWLKERQKECIKEK